MDPSNKEAPELLVALVQQDAMQTHVDVLNRPQAETANCKGGRAKGQRLKAKG